jgi:hypothetical protein
MRHVPRSRTVRSHALRLDPSAVLQGSLAASIAMFITWLSQSI